MKEKFRQFMIGRYGFEIAIYRIPQEHIVKSFVIAVIGITSHFNCNWACVPSINNTSPYFF